MMPATSLSCVSFPLLDTHHHHFAAVVAIGLMEALGPAIPGFFWSESLWARRRNVSVVEVLRGPGRKGIGSLTTSAAPGRVRRATGPRGPGWGGDRVYDLVLPLPIYSRVQVS